MSEVGSKVVMSVDDSKTIRDMVCFTVKQMGYDVLTAENGKEALNVLATQKVRLIISDINMPVMDGITLLQELRKAGANVKTPILMVTTESDQALVMKAREFGATGWIVKPFSPDKLQKVIQKVCG